MGFCTIAFLSLIKPWKKSFQCDIVSISMVPNVKNIGDCRRNFLFQLSRYLC